jgi:HK97 family phage major capsid protein
MRPTDQLLTRYASEIEEKQTFVDGLVEDAEKNKRDLTSQELELITRSRERIGDLSDQMKPLQDARRIADESHNRIAELAKTMQSTPAMNDVEYRSAGHYLLDYWQARIGDEDAMKRLQTYQRTAAHQTTTDSTGVLPAPIIGPVVNFVDSARPLVSALGPRNLPSQTWSRPKVTQHTAVLEQTAEKAELTSQKMIITKVTGTAQTFGGYVNVSRQIIDFSDPSIMDIIIADLAAQYALQTENDATDTFLAAATAASVNLATGANTAAQVAAAFWGAVGQVYAGTKGAGRVIAAAAPQMLGLIGPLFAPVNPQDSQSTGFSAVNYGQGAAGTISGVPIYITAGLADNKIMVLSTAAAEVYEDRIGALSVVEPSVLGVQVAYAGHFTPLVIDATGIIAITKTP